MLRELESPTKASQIGFGLRDLDTKGMGKVASRSRQGVEEGVGW